MLFDELAELMGQRNAIDGRIVEIVAEMDRDDLVGHHGCTVDRGVGGLEDRLARRETPRRSPPSRTGSRSFRAARRACGKADCPWIKSASSPRRPATDLMSTM